MMPGVPNLQAILQQAQQMQADMAQAQAELALAEVVGHAGGGLVAATVSGDGQLKALVIDPSVVDPTDVETLADLIIAAVRDAGRAAAELAGQTIGSVTGGMAGGRRAGRTWWLRPLRVRSALSRRTRGGRVRGRRR